MRDYVAVEYWYKIEGEVVYKYQRINGGEWEKIPTPHKEIPFIKFPPSHEQNTRE